MTREDPAPFAPPPAFGPFRVLHQIGVGALGPVFRTYEPTRDRLIAVKVFQLDITPEQARSLADELSRAADAGLFHPSIVEPVAAGLEGTVAFRAEEYVAAETLDAAIRHYAPAPVERVLPFLTQLAGAIDFARAAGIGHGALHLRDVFVTPDEVRISGFGVAEALERTGLRAPVRRPYTAPERIAGAPWSTPADVFSLAAICYELLTARRPSGTGADIGDLGLRDGHAAMLHAVLARAMDDDPDARFPSALGFASALEAAARGEQVSAAVGQVGAIAAPAAAPGAAAAVDEFDASPEPPATATDSDGDDIAIERDEDALYYDLAEEERDVHTKHAAEFEPFDDIAAEADEDLAFAPPPASVELDGEAPLETGTAAFALTADDEEPPRVDLEPRVRPVPAQAAIPYEDVALDDDGEGADPYDLPGAAPAYVPAVEPARSDMLPRAIFLVLGLLIGFAAGYASRGAAPPALVAQDDASPRSDAAPPALAGAETEQPVTAPATAPEVPSEAPPDALGPAGAPAAATGRLIITSTPAKAAVTVNGEWSGRTPLTLDGRPFGRYEIRVVQEGYQVATETVVLSPASPSRSLAVRLERTAKPAPPPARTPPPSAQKPPPPATQKPAVYTGSLYVDSRPRGARVLVNNKPVGTTPLRLSDLPVGSHVVRLELENHRIWSTSATVTAGQESRVSGSLDPIR